MKRCIAVLAPEFNTHRMVKEYATKYYFPAHTLASRLARSESGDLREAREVADHIDRCRRAWPGVRIKSVHCAHDPHGDGVNVAAAVRLAGLKPDEVSVEVHHGAVDATGNIADGVAVPMQSRQALGDTTFQYVGSFHSGSHHVAGAAGAVGAPSHAVCVRVLPGDPRLASRFIPGLITASPPAAVEADHGLHV